MKYKFKRKPLPYQYAALQKALKLNKAVALWFDPGLGKTKVAIDFIGVQRMKSGLKRVVVICPLSAIGVWEDEIPVDLPEDMPVNIFPVVGDRDDKIRVLRDAVLNTRKTSNINVVIINYDTARDVIFENWLKKFSPELLIIDEMHYTKNHAAQRSKAVYRIRQIAKWVMGLTGTPMPKNPLDVFGQYKILDEEIFGANYQKFKNYYAVPHFMFPNKIIDWKNLDDMARKIHTIACRVRDDEAKNLPKLIVRDVPIHFTSKSKEIYKQMAEEMIAELEGMETVTAAIAAVKAMKLQQITGGFLMRTDVFEQGGKPVKQQVTFPVGTEKLDVFMDLIDKYVENHKILVGCRFLWEIAQITSRLTKAGIGHVVVKGGMDGNARSDARRKFQEDKQCRVIIFQVSAATAMTLTAGDIGILYSCTRKWDDYWQWLKRIHREGQTKPVYILRLIVKGTIDKQVITDIETKRSFTDNMVDRSRYRDILKPKF